MKYIRVYENDYEQEYITTYQDHCEHVANLQDNGFEFEGCIVKQADTIEELCDRCVVIHKYGEQPKDMSFYDAQYFIDVWTRKVKSADPIVAIYGAIWTDKGLIYVAKMNDKGELELL